jgi:hypothetical protein
MATVYDTVKFQEIERVIARHKDVQRKLDREARRIAKKAESLLDARSDERTGHAHIEIEKGSDFFPGSDGFIDRYVVLVDESGKAGPGGALSIETGHYVGARGDSDDDDDEEKRTFVPGKWVISDASGVPRSR